MGKEYKNMEFLNLHKLQIQITKNTNYKMSISHETGKDYNK